MDNRNEIRDFLTSRRARITPDQAGLPAYGGHRRVAGLRREEVAMLAGVSADYYTRLEPAGRRPWTRPGQPRASRDSRASASVSTSGRLQKAKRTWLRASSLWS